MNTVFRIAPAALLVAGTIAIFPAQAGAQTATNLKCNGCVGANDLGNNSVRRSKIRSGAITSGKLSTPTSAAGTYTSAVTDIGVNELIQTLEVDLPGPGIVVVNASGYIHFASSDTVVDCGLSDTSILNTSPFVRASGSSTSPDTDVPFAVTRAFKENSGGTKTYNLICSTAQTGSNDIGYPAMTATYARVDMRVTP